MLGKQFQVKDPKAGVDVTKREVIGEGKETGGSNSIVGDPTCASPELDKISYSCAVPSWSVFCRSGWI